jgi:hypothetical protein
VLICSPVRREIARTDVPSIINSRARAAVSMSV